MKFLLQFLMLVFFAVAHLAASAQTKTPNDPEAATLLKTISDKYKAYNNISISFKLIIAKPKMKPTDDERKLTDTLSGTALLSGSKFSVDINRQKTICDGKNIWTYMPADKEVQVNYYTEGNDIFAPSKIFNLYREGFNYQTKEKKTVNSKSITVIELVPGNMQTFFKIDVSIDEAAQQIVETKIYERNGTRYTYKIAKQTPNTSATAASFTFDAAKYPGVRVTDLR
jgi:outer membrane lipoprotein carrier protein